MPIPIVVAIISAVATVGGATVSAVSKGNIANKSLRAIDKQSKAQKQAIDAQSTSDKIAYINNKDASDANFLNIAVGATVLLIVALIIFGIRKKE